MKRSIIVLGAALIGAFAVMGAAATLGVSSKKVDSFTADQAATTVPSDATPPALVSLQMFDTGTTPNGKVDQVVATFSEPLQLVTDAPGGWTLSSTPSGGLLSDVDVVAGTSTATLSISEGPNAADTSVGSFKLTLDFATSTIKDAAGNKASFAATAPVDKARPVPTSIVVSNKSGGNDGKPEVDDFATIVFSEQLDRQTICANTTDTDWSIAAAGRLDNDNQVVGVFTELASPSVDPLSATSTACTGGLQFGSITFDDDGYVTQTTNFRGSAPNQTELTWTPSTASLRLTLGSPDQTTGDVNASSVTAVYSVGAATMTDLAGNAAAGAVSSAKVRQF